MPDGVTVVGLFILASLTTQNASEALLLRYVTGLSKDANTVNFMMLQIHCELLKLVISIPMLIGTVAKLPSFSSLFFSKDAAKMSVPASLYFVQNWLGIVGFSRVPVPIVAVLGQTKVATSAIFTVIMLGRKFTAAQIRALVQVVLGASLVVLHTSEAMEQAKGADQPVHQFLLGVGALVSAYSISGLNCVYMEKVLKGTGSSVATSLWHKNVQLAVFGLVFALLMMLVRDPQSITLQVFLATGHGLLYWLTVILGAVGGILVAFALKFTDAMLKSFAQSVAVIIKTVMSAIIFGDVALGFYFVIGGCNVALGVINYNAGRSQATKNSGYVPATVISVNEREHPNAYSVLAGAKVAPKVPTPRDEEESLLSGHVSSDSNVNS